MGKQKYPRKYKNGIIEETQIKKIQDTYYISHTTQGIGYIENNEIYRKHASGVSREIKSDAETIKELLKLQFV